MSEKKDHIVEATCYHCGETCTNNIQSFKDKVFCCSGCKMVYSILSKNDMEDYYKYEKTPGIKVRFSETKQFDFLDDPSVSDRLIRFEENSIYRITLELPQIHCSSCLWLLENLSKLNAGVLSCKVNFIQKTASIVANKEQIKLSSLVKLLSSIGYEPRLTLESLENKNSKTSPDKTLLYKLGLAGFAFGNIMLLSFPEYLGFEKASNLFYLGFINVILALPVLFYSGFDYLKSAFISIRHAQLNLDIPIALGMLVLFSRSIYEITSGVGEGYLDSFSGFVFFLLIGKWFQSFTYKALDFERKYSSYFPISVNVRNGQKWQSKQLENVTSGDIVLIRNQEIIPCDSILIRGKGRIDYSFVTGESDIISKDINGRLFAGGKNCGSTIEIKVLKKIEDSYLTQLWKEKTFQSNSNSSLDSLINRISKYFIYAIILIAIIGFSYWFQIDPIKAFDVFTATLIVACPCALALSIPFTYGNIIRLLSKRGLYLRNVETIEKIQDLDQIIFDKTGTLTDTDKIRVKFNGTALNRELCSVIKSACNHSSHPLSQAISKSFENIELVEIDEYKDYIGLGFTALVNNKVLRLGSSDFIFHTKLIGEKGVHIEYANQYIGHFSFEHQLREGMGTLIKALENDYALYVLSGDQSNSKNSFLPLFKEEQLIFNQNPNQKLQFIKNQQQKLNKVMMIGDGLNDAGALKQANVGIVFTNSSTNFSPACDGIFLAQNSKYLESILKFIIASRWIVYGAFFLALLYNIIGLYFALSGQLTPVIAAILMPLSSVSIIIYGIGCSMVLFAYFLNIKKLEK